MNSRTEVSELNPLREFYPVLPDKLLFGIKNIPDSIESMRDVSLESANDCLVLGVDSGDIEFLFIQKCLPNLTSLTVVDNKPIELARFGELVMLSCPKVATTSLKAEPAQDWKGPERPVDVIIMFHTIVYPHDKQLALLKRALRGWLKPGGVAYLSVNTTEEKLSYHGTSDQKVIDLDEDFRSCELAKQLLYLGLTIEREYFFEFPLDALDLGQSSLDRTSDIDDLDAMEEFLAATSPKTDYEKGASQVVEVRYPWTVIKIRRNCP